jgi:hypothetical protein
MGELLGALAAGKTLGGALDDDHALGTICVTQVGPQYKLSKAKVFSRTQVCFHLVYRSPSAIPSDFTLLLGGFCLPPVQQILLPPPSRSSPGRAVVGAFLGDRDQVM